MIFQDAAARAAGCVPHLPRAVGTVGAVKGAERASTKTTSLVAQQRQLPRKQRRHAKAAFDACATHPYGVVIAGGRQVAAIGRPSDICKQ